eukprot:6187501-Pleurochrysis_carterae.AAC.4
MNMIDQFRRAGLSQDTDVSSVAANPTQRSVQSCARNALEVYIFTQEGPPQRSDALFYTPGTP